jgi:hypothetical protein
LLLLEETSSDASEVKVQPEELPFVGFSPRWLP